MTRTGWDGEGDSQRWTWTVGGAAWDDGCGPQDWTPVVIILLYKGINKEGKVYGRAVTDDVKRIANSLIGEKRYQAVKNLT